MPLPRYLAGGTSTTVSVFIANPTPTNGVTLRANFAKKAGFACNFVLTSAQLVGAGATRTYLSTTANGVAFDRSRLLEAVSDPTRYFAEAGVLKVMNVASVGLVHGWNYFTVKCTTENTLMDFEVLMN